MAGPVSVSLRASQVGFGDCFVLTFRYAKGKERHVLIDFGSTGAPRKRKSSRKAKGKKKPTLMAGIAQSIHDQCKNGELVAVVATHRHADHISGFGDKTAAKIIESLSPRWVVQPWTEHPRAKPKATSAPSVKNGQAFVAALDSMHSVADAVRHESAALWRAGAISDAEHSRLEFLGKDNIKNLAAVSFLKELGKGCYLRYGDRVEFQKRLPGVKVRVLGPPDLTQSSEIRQQREVDAAEYWHLMGLSRNRMAGRKGKVEPLFPDASRAKAIPAEAVWLVERMRRTRAEQLLGIVRSLDKAMNNTSLILLFEVGRKLLLFPGDAQIENWSFALKEAKNFRANRTLLKKVRLYKVGHHGSLNATPRSLWKLLPKGKSKLSSVVSTMAGKHGSRANKTEVPRRKLVAALKAESTYHTTQRPERGKNYLEIEI